MIVQRLFTSVCILSFALLGILGRMARGTEKQSAPPTSVEFAASSENFATMLNKLHPGNRIGYRFHEHKPIVYGPVPESTALAGIDPAEVARMEREFASRPDVFICRREVRVEDWAPQDWVFHFVPVREGFELLWVITAQDQGLNEYYAAQQCFRMSGQANEGWRQKIALTPAFSEYDLWADRATKTSLSFVRRNDTWEEIPPIEKHVVCRTPLGVEMDTKRSDGKLWTITGLEPYGPSQFEPTIDCGLATRTDAAGTWVCALYWERTTHVTNHHPADCLHSFVDLGPIPPHGKRAIRGKIYWTRASKEELFSLWKSDFPGDAR